MSIGNVIKCQYLRIAIGKFWGRIPKNNRSVGKHFRTGGHFVESLSLPHLACSKVEWTSPTLPYSVFLWCLKPQCVTATIVIDYPERSAVVSKPKSAVNNLRIKIHGGCWGEGLGGHTI